MKSLGVAVLAVGVGIGLAPPAAASEDEYVAKLRALYPYLSAEQLITEGQQACELISTGRSSSDAVPVVMKNLGVGGNTAITIVTAAADEFDC